PRYRRGGSLVPRRRGRRAVAEPRRPLGIRARAAAAPRRRARPRAGRPRTGRACLRLRSRCRGAPAPAECPARADQGRARRGGDERVERADERGQFAVRGGLVDVFPTTGREPLRIEFWGDEIEGIRAFSPFTQRALHAVDDAAVYPATERRLDLFEPQLLDDDDPIPVPKDLV